MSKRKLAMAAGALIVIGGAAAIAAVGHREGRIDHRGGMGDIDGMMVAQMPGMGGPGEGRWRERFRRGEVDQDHDHGRGSGMRGGWFGRGMTGEQFDARTRERFARLDRNSDGVIDAAEVEAGINERMEGRRPFRDMFSQRMRGRFDTNRDGKIARQEALDRVRRDFERMDLDGDGRITDADLPPMMRGRGVLKGEGPMGMRGRGGMGPLGRLIEADANRDGIITLDEALAAAGRRFDQADHNKDGVIDTADRDAIAKETTDYRVRRFMHAFGAKDGRVTREQFFARAKERFAEMDLNNDGRIDRQDWMGGRGPGAPDQGRMGPGTGRDDRPGSGPGPDGRGMRDRGPPR